MRQAHLEAMLADPWARTGWEATVVFEGVTYEGGTIEVHGNRSRRFPKKSFRLTFPHRITTDFFSSGHPEEHRRLVLQASWVDPTYLRNRLTMALVRSLGGLAPRIEHAVLAVNGEDFGLYTVIERIDKVYLERQGLDPTGNLYKAEEAGADWVDKPDPLLDMEQEINPENPTDDLRHLFEAVTQTPATEVDFRAVIEPLLDLDGYMTWQCVHSFARDMDTFIKNYYLYHDLDEPPGDPAGRFRVISWDADATFGITWNGDPVSTTSQKWHGRDSFAPRLFGIPFYRDRYLALYEAALDGPFSPEQLLPGLVEVAARIAPAAEADLLAWDRGVTFDEALDALLDAVRTRHQVMAEAIRSLR